MLLESLKMKNEDFISQMKSKKFDSYAKATIQAILSSVKLSILESVEELDLNRKHAYADKMIILAVMDWERIRKCFDVEFPDLFIQSGILAYCGNISITFLDRIGLCYDVELAKTLKVWLNEREILD